MVLDPGFPDKFQVTLYLPPLAFRADAPMAVGFCVLSLVDVAAPQEGIVLTVSDDGLAQGFCFQHSPAHPLI